MPKVFLTDKWLGSPPKVAAGGRIDYSDATAGLVARISHKGQATFVVLARFPGQTVNRLGMLTPYRRPIFTPL
jgi:hypothetical protein